MYRSELIKCTLSINIAIILMIILIILIISLFTHSSTVETALE